MPVPENKKTALQVLPHNDKPDSFEIVAEQLSAVTLRMREELNTSSESVRNLFDHIIDKPGKMLRPAMVLLAGGSCGEINDTHIEIAAMFELIHTATLLHDDVIDEAQNRRNAETVNSLWGNECAVLSGDFLLSRVFAMSSRMGSGQYSEVLAETATKICHGELMQNMQRQNWQLDKDAYFEIIKDKTAVMFESCCYLGALASQADNEQVEGLSVFGLNVGLAFQITDDLLDIVGNENMAGKTLGSDFLKGKITLPVIHLLTTASNGEKETVMQQLSDAGSFHGDITDMLTRSGSIAYARSIAANFCEKAIRSLTSLPDSDAKSSLVRIAESVASRC